MTLIERSIMNRPRNDASDVPSVADTLSSALRAIRQHFWLVAFCTVVSLTLAIVSIVTMTPIYTASATIYIDPRESRGFQEAGGVLLNSDALVVDSEVEILLSSTLAERVVDRLGLALVEETDADTPTLTASLKALFTADAIDESQAGLLSPEDAAKRRAVAAIRRNVDVGRLGNTYVIEITARNRDKKLAAEIANTYTEEYLKSGLEIQAERLTQLNNWSSAALREALSALQLAEAEVNQFRLVNQIDSDGRQVAGSELTEMNNELVKLRSERFQNELMLERIEAFVSDGSADSDVPDIGVEEIAQIRSRILEAEIEYARETATGNKNKLLADVLPRQLEAMKAQLIDQYQRVATQLGKQIQFSIEEEQRLSDRAEALRREVSEMSEKEAKLRELQMKSDSERAVYQVLLTRFHETSDVFAYKSNSARVLTAAHVPPGPSSPQTFKILALGLVGGLFVGLVLTFIREQLDDRIRQPREIEAAGLRFLGAAPMIRGVWFQLRGRRSQNRRDLNMPVLTGGRRRRELARMSYAVDFPLSEFSETVRSIVFDAAASDPSAARAHIVAVTSTSPGEGKSTLAANLAAYFAKQGKRVHLIDFDLKNPSLSRIFAKRRANWTPTEEQSKEPGETAHTGNKRVRDFDFSGHVGKTSASDMIKFISPGTIANYLQSSKENYDVVVVDVGSLSESSDARMCADLADYVVLAVRWGMTPREQFERSLARGLNRTGRSVGAVLTMVPPSAELEKSAAGDQTARRLAVA
ncbi:MAG: polysaccharide biosynthesis tyrosine autokinase [Paracoccaceae bacterium]|nr:polysaccharide biosynthesis tyrosine autokinase [Paracoccaceae bacterium]